MSAKIKLICLDVDGTIIGSQPNVHPRVWAMATELRQAGVSLAICTGRPALGRTRQFAEELDPQGWHIFQGGASLLNLANNRAHSLPLSEEALKTLIAQHQDKGWVLELYSDDDYVCNQPVDGTMAAQLAQDHAKLLELPYETRDFKSLNGAVVRAQWVVSDAQLSEVFASASPLLNYASATSPSVPGAHFVSVTMAGVDKCSAIRKLAEEVVGCGLEGTMMVGDGHNDISALEMVGYPVAMANAVAELKAVAKYMAGHVDQGGAAEALKLAQKINAEAE